MLAEPVADEEMIGLIDDRLQRYAVACASQRAVDRLVEG